MSDRISDSCEVWLTPRGEQVCGKPTVAGYPANAAFGGLRAPGKNHALQDSLEGELRKERGLALASANKMGGGFMALCAEHAPKHASITQPVADIKAGVPHPWRKP